MRIWGALDCDSLTNLREEMMNTKRKRKRGWLKNWNLKNKNEVGSYSIH